MGCWNETCVLTQLPIYAGSDVVELRIVQGARYRASDGAGDTALLFGLPLKGRYDDYGGVEDYERPELVELSDKAFEACGLYRRVPLKAAHGNRERLMVGGPGMLWGLESALEHLFYSRRNVFIGDRHGYDPEARARQLAAFKDCEAALKSLGEQLQTIELSTDEREVEETLFGLVKNVFGEAQAWSAWHVLMKNGLFVSRGSLLMHRSAYDAAVADFSRRKIHSTGASMTLREKLQEKFLSWKALYDDHRRTVAANPELACLAKDAYAPRCDYLAPLSRPWLCSQVPIVGHFWGGANVDEVLAAHGLEELLDLFVFQYARHALRLDLVKSQTGSQCGETMLPHVIRQAVMKTLRDQKQHRRDFVPFFS